MCSGRLLRCHHILGICGVRRLLIIMRHDELPWLHISHKRIVLQLSDASRQNNKKDLRKSAGLFYLAEREGFEPSLELAPH